MATRDERFPRRFLKAADFEDGDSLLVIEKVYQEEFEKDGVKETGTVISFQGVEMELRCNPTNWDMIAAQHGGDDAQWKGKQVTLGSREVKSFGEIKPAIRVIPPAKAVKTGLPGKKTAPTPARTSETEAAYSAADDKADPNHPDKW
jgi:hypothetical protein